MLPGNKYVCVYTCVCVCETCGNLKQLNLWRMFFIHRWLKKKAFLFSYSTFLGFGASHSREGCKSTQCPPNNSGLCLKVSFSWEMRKTVVKSDVPWWPGGLGALVLSTKLYEKVQFVTFASDGLTCLRQPRKQNLSIGLNPSLGA